MPFSGLISGAHQIGASLINYRSQQDANDTNIALARQQNQYNLDQWMRENQYNLPRNQVERLKAAGINPALAYANGSMMNESAPSPQMTAGRVQAPYVSPVDLSQIRLNDAMANKADAEADAANATAGNTREDTRSKQIANALAGIDLKAWESLDKEGLIEDAKRAGLEQDIRSNDLTSYQLIEAAWDFLIYTGYPEDAMTGQYGAGHLRDDMFTYDPVRLKKAQAEFVGTQDANIATQNAARILASKQAEFNGNSGEIMKEINDAAAKGEVWAKICKIALFILEQRSGQPGISLSFSPTRSKDYSSHITRDNSSRETKVFNAPFK